MSDYTENFAEAYKLKQQKMLGELQSIYDEKTGLSQRLNKLTQDLVENTEEGTIPTDPDEEGSLIFTGRNSKTAGILDGIGLPEAVMLVETPTSLANDSQLRQLLSNMQNQFNQMEDEEEDESHKDNQDSDSMVLANNYKDIGEIENKLNQIS